jgi:hypothetical protein
MTPEGIVVLQCELLGLDELLADCDRVAKLLTEVEKLANKISQAAANMEFEINEISEG